MIIKDLDFIYEEGKRLINGEPSTDWKRLGRYLMDENISDKKAILSEATVLMLHLLKCEYQPEKITKSWHNSIENSFSNLQISATESKVLYNYLKDNINKVYIRAKNKASRETNLSLTIFPKECPYIIDNLISDDWIFDFLKSHTIADWR